MNNMTELPAPTEPKRNAVSLVARGCLGILCLGLCGLLVLFGRQQIMAKNAPTPTITPTPIPQILVDAPVDLKSVIHEDFSSNENEWGLFFNSGKLDVINGKLILQSDPLSGVTIGTSQKVFPTREHYYVQAAFSAESQTTAAYGLVFGLNRSQATYYLFKMWPRAAGSQLLKYNAGKWTELVPYSPANISPYSQATTLSVDFYKGHMKLYINGKLLTEYSDKEFFLSKDVGIYVNNGGYRLVVDDFFVSNKE